MKSLRIANRLVLNPALLMVAFAATSALAAPKRTSGTSAGQTRNLTEQFQARFAESLLVLIPAQEVSSSKGVVQTSSPRDLPNVLTGQRVSRSSLVSALLESKNFGLGGGSQAVAAAAGKGRGRGRGPGNDGNGHRRQPASPNRPPGLPPGPPDGVPPGPPDGVPNGPKPK